LLQIITGTAVTTATPITTEQGTAARASTITGTDGADTEEERNRAAEER